MPHNYGLISDVDASVLEKTLDLIIADFPNQPICVTEVGLYNGRTSKGIKEYIESKGREVKLTGIDNQRDNEKLVFFPPTADLIIGNSNEVAYKVPEHSQHMIFIDGLHTLSGVISDFFCYATKVKYDGFICFHDTAPYAQGRDWQRTGSKEDKYQYISVRKALELIGLLDTPIKPLLSYSYDYYSASLDNWSLYFDEYDKENTEGCGGVTVFKRIA